MAENFTQNRVVVGDELIINNNPFQLEAMSDYDACQEIFQDSFNEDFNNGIKNAIQNLDFISINKKYGKLQEAYNDVKQLANTYSVENTKKSALESKLNRYMP